METIWQLTSSFTSMILSNKSIDVRLTFSELLKSNPTPPPLPSRAECTRLIKLFQSQMRGFDFFMSDITLLYSFRRMQGLNDALKRLNDYMSVPDSGPQIAQAGSVSNFKIMQ